jgi:hypothetical protein
MLNIQCKNLPGGNGPFIPPNDWGLIRSLPRSPIPSLALGPNPPLNRPMNPLFCDDVVDERLVDPVDALVPLREAVVCGLVHTTLPVNVRPHINFDYFVELFE